MTPGDCTHSDYTRPLHAPQRTVMLLFPRLLLDVCLDHSEDYGAAL